MSEKSINKTIENKNLTVSLEQNVALIKDLFDGDDTLRVREFFAGGKIDPKYNKIVHELFVELWKFAKKTDDVCINAYIMTAPATEGPGVIYE